MTTLFLVGMGGFIGANLRYLISLWASRQFGTKFPWATWIISLSGALALDVFSGWANGQASFNHNLELFFSIGLLGSYATFAAYELENILLITDKRWKLAALHLVGVNVASVVLVFLGVMIGTCVNNIYKLIKF